MNMILNYALDDFDLDSVQLLSMNHYYFRYLFSSHAAFLYINNAYLHESRIGS